MGKSYTYHIIGIGKADNSGNSLCYPCMNKREMAQAVKKADYEGRPMEYWQAQTKTGARWIKGDIVPCGSVKLPKLVICPACKGRQHKTGEAFYVHCPVCNSSGWTTPGYEKNWQPLQIEQMREKAVSCA